MGQIKTLLFSVIMGALLISCQKEPLAFEKLGVSINRFTVNINTAPEGKPERIETDWGVLIRPSHLNSTMLRLVIYCHSGGGATTGHGSEAEMVDVVRYLVYKGYAVMDVCGMPEDFARRIQVDLGRTVGSPVALRAVVAGYNYVTTNFKIATDGCFVLSNSNGGLLASNIVNLTDIPVLAQSGLAPLISTEHNAWFVSSAAMFIPDGFGQFQNRANVIRLFDMKKINTQSELNQATYESDKVGKYDPFDYCINQTIEPYPVPYLIFTHEEDQAVFYNIAAEFAAKLNARGSKIEISKITEYGAHNVKPEPIIVGSFNYMGQDENLKLTVKTIGDFFDHYNPNPQL